MTRKCEICDKSDSKYKCPKCEIPYCSLECFKQHKDSIECSELIKKRESDRKKSSFQPKPLLFTTMDTVPLEELQKLQNSEHLKNLLYNPHLRKLLTELDRSSNPERAIGSAMMEPLFLEFADECLKIIEPSDIADDENSISSDFLTN
ncbi:zinc finger HIT domain-containing protein 3 [Culicoides brevitarsis]|uniref:zinc finger HIT domain-containing protein 3 n=1 Tax=Culicoides brevitarsis TaxID=469753 RepID=UPI00307BC346